MQPALIGRPLSDRRHDPPRGDPRQDILRTSLELMLMKKISIAFLAVMSLAASGCRKNKGAEALARLTVLKDKMCACKDKTCSDKVSVEFSSWRQEQEKSDGDKPGTPGEEDPKMEEVTEQLSQCLMKIELPGGAGAAGAAGGAGATGGAGGTMGSGSPAAGSSDGSAAAGSAH
jgi:hypothetical protein